MLKSNKIYVMLCYVMLCVCPLNCHADLSSGAIGLTFGQSLHQHMSRDT